ncbi:MAG TPA: hypothetical protein VK427_06535 [Kofleriaceae bacterium]|nr:hypothetical protein [Kofleriaceae bacterium]
MTALSGSAFAQAALDDTSPGATPEPGTPAAEAPDEVEYGVGLRLRNVRIPQAELELFMERAPGGTSNIGIGVDLTRRRGTVELQLGFEYENVTPAEGVYIESGKNVAGGDEADFILSPERADSSLGWFTVEFTFLNHTPLNKHIALRYGGGAGIGIVTGALKRIDVACNNATNANPEPGCVPPPMGSASPTQGGTPIKYSLPPVFPVVNAIIGLQYKPTPKATVNFEMGLRTLLFFGLSGSYFF